jgi:hypothetical protein
LAIVFNLGSQLIEDTISVQFFDNNPDVNGIQIGENKTINNLALSEGNTKLLSLIDSNKTSNPLSVSLRKTYDFENPDAIGGNDKWFFDIKDANGDFRISRLGSGVQEMNLTPSGDLKIPGNFISGGTPLPQINQVHLEDSNDPACENRMSPPTLDSIGWCPNGVRNIFIIHDPMITANSVVMANLGALVLPVPNCQLQFVNPFEPPTAPGFNFSCDFGGPGPPDGIPLNYVIINPPPAP